MHIRTMTCMVPQLEELGPRICPTHLTPGGGPVLTGESNVYLIVEPQTPDRDVVGIAQIACQLEGLLEAFYPVGGAHIAGVVNVPNQGNVYDVDAGNIAIRLIQSGQLPRPGPNDIYVLLLSPGHFAINLPAPFGGDHGWSLSPWGPLYWNCDNGWGDSSIMPQIIYHECCETKNDPQPPNGYVDRQTFLECGDVYEGDLSLQFDYQGYTWAPMSGPNGEVITPGATPLPPGPPPPPTPPPVPLVDYFVLLWENAELALFSLAEHFNRAFAPLAHSAALSLADNPATSTPLGQQLLAAEDAAFQSLLTG